MNKENIEPKKIHSTRELISRMYTNAANLKHIAETGTINGSLLQEIERVMNEYANEFRGVTESPDQTPVISSNEGETVESPNVQEGKENQLADKYFLPHPEPNEYWYPNVSVKDLQKTAFKLGYEAGQSQHSYTEDKWINVEDRLPEKDGDSSIYCLVSTKHEGIVVRPYNEYHKCWDQEDGDDHFTAAVGGDVTHWQRLPLPPKK